MSAKFDACQIEVPDRLRDWDCKQIPLQSDCLQQRTTMYALTCTQTVGWWFKIAKQANDLRLNKFQMSEIVSKINRELF